MSSGAFADIVGRHEGIREQLDKLSDFLARRSVGAAIRLDNACDFIGLVPEIMRPILDELVEDGLLRTKTLLVCPDCDALLDGDEDECDECLRSFDREELQQESCFFLLRPHIHLPIAKKDLAPMRRSNPLSDTFLQQRCRVRLWSTLRESDYTISVTTLDGGTKERALESLHSLGIVRLRWQGDPPTAERLASLENWLGPARNEQNDYKGKVKSLVPDWNVEPNTGDSSKALKPHVDGTQDELTPAMLAFQYDYSPTWGGESTFFDMAAVLSEVPVDELERILSTLSRSDCSTCTKTKGEWTKTVRGPLVRAENDGESLSIRLRMDNLLTVSAECQLAFDALKAHVCAWEEDHVLRYTPHEGDVVIFDNWRLLHGRAAIGGRHKRIHDRMWMDRLLPEYSGRFALGIRPISAELMAAVQRGNAG